MITIGGGKWTTYRRMAQDAVDYAIARADLQGTAPCRTEALLLAGAEGYDPGNARRLATHYSLEPDVALHLLHAYGSRADQLVALFSEVGNTRLSPGHPFLEAEVVWAARQELAQTALDVLARRTRLAFLDQAAALAALPRTVELMGDELDWGDTRRQQELETGRARLERGI
jgi:glycerol-3-phosphate dehydrogenase